MCSAVGTAIRERVSLWEVLVVLASVVIFRVILEVSLLELALLFGVLGLQQCADAARSVDVSDAHVSHAAIAVVALAATVPLAQLATDSYGIVIIALMTAMRSGYSAVKATRSRDETSDSAVETPTTRAVRDALEGRPRTRRELWEAVDAEPNAVDTALEGLQDRNTVIRAGSEYRLDADSDPDPGLFERVRSWLFGEAPRADGPSQSTEYDAGLSSISGDGTGQTPRRTPDAADSRNDTREDYPSGGAPNSGYRERESDATD